MKGQKLVSLDISLLEKLQKEQNASELINKLLKEHYETEPDVQEINKELRRLEQRKILLEGSLKKIHEKKLKEERLNVRSQEQARAQMEIKKRKERAAKLMEQWRNGKITEEEYWKQIDSAQDANQN